MITGKGEFAVGCVWHMFPTILGPHGHVTYWLCKLYFQCGSADTSAELKGSHFHVVVVVC